MVCSSATGPSCDAPPTNWVEAADALDASLIEVEQGLFQMRATGTGQDGVRYPARLMESLGYLLNTV